MAFAASVERTLMVLLLLLQAALLRLLLLLLLLSGAIALIPHLHILSHPLHLTCIAAFWSGAFGQRRARSAYSTIIGTSPLWWRSC